MTSSTQQGSKRTKAPVHTPDKHARMHATLPPPMLPGQRQLLLSGAGPLHSAAPLLPAIPPATHQARALHDRLLPAVRHGHGQRGELRQHLSHLVTALAAAHVDDAVGVGVLGQRLADDGLAAAKGTGDGAGA